MYASFAMIEMLIRILFAKIVKVTIFYPLSINNAKNVTINVQNVLDRVVIVLYVFMIIKHLLFAIVQKPQCIKMIHTFVINVQVNAPLAIMN